MHPTIHVNTAFVVSVAILVNSRFSSSEWKFGVSSSSLSVLIIALIDLLLLTGHVQLMFATATKICQRHTVASTGVSST